MAGEAGHEDVGARAEHPLARADEHHALHLRMLEADAVERVVQLDIHPEVVAVELELVARPDSAVFIDGQRDRGDGAVHRQPDVPVLRRLGSIVDG
jgi:hypothetical protein